MTTYVLCCAYQEADNLKRMWESVQATIPGEVVLVVVDGRFTDIGYQEDFSTDGTKEYAQAQGHHLPVVDYECEKRTAGLAFIDTLAVDGDWVLNMDADETLTKFVGWPQRVGYISFTRKTAIEIPYGRCRLYRWEPGLAFKHRHYDLYDRNGELVASLEDAPDFQVVGFGDHYEKPRTPEKRDYYIRLHERERPSAVVVA